MAPRFTLQLTLRDRHGSNDLSMAIDLEDETIGYRREAWRDREEMEIGAVSLTSAAKVLEQRAFRKDLFTTAAKRLGTLLAERMEDAEGWHDESRIEPAREQLGIKPHA